MMDAVRLPRLLRRERSGAQLLETGRLHPIALSCELNLSPLSKADMTLAENDLPVQMHDLVELYGQNGSLGIFRAVNITTDYKRQRRIRLNHALDVLADAIIAGEEEITGTVSSVLSTLLAAQTAKLGSTVFWQVGTVEDTSTYTVDNKYNNVLDSLKALGDDREDYYFDFDFTTFPWTLHFRAKTDDVLTEFRLPRNVEKCQVTLDDGEQCNRLYLSVDTVTTDEDGEKTETTHEVHDDAASQAEWGVICKKAGISTKDVPDKAAWIRRYFARCAQPAVQITIDGLELCRITGEPLDRVRLGRICRTALPEYSTVFAERVVTLSYPDLLRQPLRVTVSLVNKKPNASKSFSSLSSGVSSNSSSLSETKKEVEKTKYSWHATDRHVRDHTEILHEAGLEIDPHGVWIFAKEITSSEAAQTALGASLRVQAQGITGLVEKTGINNLPGGYQSIMQYSSQVKQTADSVSAEVTAARDGQASLSARFSVQAAAISSKVSSTDYNGNTIASLINQTATTITLSASKIDLSGYVTASELSTQKARIDNLVGGTRVDALSASTVSAGTLMVDGSGAYWLSLRDSSGGAVTAAGGRSVQILGRYA